MVNDQRSRRSSRRRAFQDRLPELLEIDGGGQMTISRLYELVEREMAEFLDDEPDPSHRSRPYWKKQLQWALKDGTLDGTVTHVGHGTYARAAGWDPSKASRRTAPLEQIHTETFPVVTEHQARVFERKEAHLVEAWSRWSANEGRPIERLELHSCTGRRLVVDAYDRSRRLLVEAKALPSTVMMRLALGQLLDYSLHAQEPGHRLAVLVSAEPHPDLVDLLSRQGVGLITPTDTGFHERVDAAVKRG